MTDRKSFSDTLEAIQAEKIPGRYQRLGDLTIDTRASWSDYISQVVAERAEKAMQKRTEEIAQYQKDHPDFH